jgi:hypothetical protein
LYIGHNDGMTGQRLAVEGAGLDLLWRAVQQLGRQPVYGGHAEASAAFVQKANGRRIGSQRECGALC